MAAQAPLETLSKWAYNEMFKRHGLDLPNYSSKRVVGFCAALAEKIESVRTLVFGEMLITIATVSAKCVARVPGEALETRPNLFMLIIAPTSSGKTAAYKPFAQVREQRLVLTGIPTDANFGSDMGVVGSIAAVSKAGGAALLTADESLDELTKFLTEKKVPAPSVNGSQQSGGQFAAARCLNMLYSGTTYTRAYKTIPDLIIQSSFLSMMASGTPVHYDNFRSLFQFRGSQDGFRTRVLPVFGKRQGSDALLKAEATLSLDETAIMACSSDELMALFQESYLRLAAWFDGEGCESLTFADNACVLLRTMKRDVRMREEANDYGGGDDESGDQAWRRFTKTPRSAATVPDERLVEQTQKLALVLHLLETVFSWIDFEQKKLRPQPFSTIISAASVRAGAALLRRCREQEMFYERILKHCYNTAEPRSRIVHEHADILLYETLTARLLMWPGPVVTWESVVDRYERWFLTISFDECLEAIDTLTDYGTAQRTEDKWYASGGAKVLCDEPTPTFRFYKMPPAIIESNFLSRFGIRTEDYKARFEMEFKQVGILISAYKWCARVSVKAAYCWTRGHLEWKDVLRKTPSWLSRKRRQGGDDICRDLETDAAFLNATKVQRLEAIKDSANEWQRHWLEAVGKAVEQNRAADLK